MSTKFERGPYGSVSFQRSGCDVRVFQVDGDSSLAQMGVEAGTWCLTAGRSLCSGYATRRAAVEAAGNFLG